MSRPGKRAGFGEFQKQPTPYDVFMESEGIPVFRGIGVRKVQNLPLRPGSARGGQRHLHPAPRHREANGAATSSRCRRRGALNPEKHLYEEIYFVVEGRGTTEVWLDGDSKRHVFEWQKGSLFSIPVNAWHRIVNASSQPRAAARPAPPRRT